MATCAHCGKRILLSGTKVGDARYCREACADAAQLPAFTAAMQAATVATEPVPAPTPTPIGPSDSMLVDREGAKPGLVIATGVVVAILISIGLHAAESSLEAQLRGLNFAVILPVGAALNGAIVAIGFFAAVRLLDSPPRTATFVAACGAAVLLSWLTYAISYFTMTDEDGAPVRGFLSFPEFIRIIIENSEIALGRGKSSAVTAGRWGYALYAADCIGFAIGAWLVVRAAGAKPFCAKCGRFMAKLGRIARTGDDAAAAGATVGAMYGYLGANDAQRAADTLAAFGAAGEKSFFGVVLECHGCPMCKDYSAVVTTTLAGAKGRRGLHAAEYPGHGAIRLA